MKAKAEKSIHDVHNQSALSARLYRHTINRWRNQTRENNKRLQRKLQPRAGLKFSRPTNGVSVVSIQALLAPLPPVAPQGLNYFASS